MNHDDYIQDALATESPPERAIANFSKDPAIVRLVHGMFGLSTEAGELLDLGKRYVFYGKEIPVVNLVEELGDISWYFALCLAASNLSLESVLRANLAKLRQKRYKQGFTEADAINRDVEAEYKAIQEVIAQTPPAIPPSVEGKLRLLEELMLAAGKYAQRDKYPEAKHEEISQDYAHRMREFQALLIKMDSDLREARGERLK